MLIVHLQQPQLPADGAARKRQGGPKLYSLPGQGRGHQIYPGSVPEADMVSAGIDQLFGYTLLLQFQCNSNSTQLHKEHPQTAHKGRPQGVWASYECRHARVQACKCRRVLISTGL
jgi:hypothetical protein